MKFDAGGIEFVVNSMAREFLKQSIDKQAFTYVEGIIASEAICLAIERAANEHLLHKNLRVRVSTGKYGFNVLMNAAKRDKK